VINLVLVHQPIITFSRKFTDLTYSNSVEAVVRFLKVQQILAKYTKE